MRLPMGLFQCRRAPVHRRAPPVVSFRGAERRGNLAVQGWITGRLWRKRSCLPEIATSAVGLLAMTNRGWCRFNDGLYGLPVRRREGHAPPLQREAGDQRILHNSFFICPAPTRARGWAHRGMGKMRAFFFIFLHFLHAPRMRLHPAPNAQGWVTGFADQISR